MPDLPTTSTSNINEPYDQDNDPAAYVEISQESLDEHEGLFGKRPDNLFGFPIVYTDDADDVVDAVIMCGESREPTDWTPRLECELEGDHETGDFSQLDHAAIWQGRLYRW